jgi:hypothetical protein
MPRRNHNAGRTAVDADRLAADINNLAVILTIADAKYPCAGCRKHGHWNGGYCPLCKGGLTLAARAHALTRR